jgi:vanillate O-demethylase ferredoxin subunit
LEIVLADESAQMSSDGAHTGDEVGPRLLTLCEVRTVADNIKMFQLRSDVLLPRWTPGAHIRIATPVGERAYSLIDWGQDQSHVWTICVRLEDRGDGGSRYMHSLVAGAQIDVHGPYNRFELGRHEAPALLLAGGIGVTPLISMARALEASGRNYRLVYAGRSRSALALQQEINQLCKDKASLHADDDPSRLDLQKLIETTGRATHLYVCGPPGMIDATLECAAANGFPSTQIHFELFSNKDSEAEDGSFEVEARQSGKTVTVLPGQSIIDALEAAGIDLIYDCKRGDCGICRCDVLEGEPDHRDVVLTPDERASNKTIQICVSRSKTPRLVLDI